MSSPRDLTWRVMIDPPRSGADNMARDHALAARLREGTGVVRFYRWNPPTLSFGRNEPVTSAYRRLLRDHPELGVVRRPTGGRAVIHDGELTYSLAFPSRAFGGARGAYRRITQALLAGLQALGVDAEGAVGRALPPDAGPCFQAPTAGEIVVEGRKIVGSAQARFGSALLQHGSLLLSADQGRLGKGAEAPAITLRQVLGEIPDWARLVEALTQGFAQTLGGRWEPGVPTEAEASLEKDLAESRYGSATWTWRR